MSFKLPHAPAILEGGAAMAWFEVHPENYMVGGGERHRLLTRLRESHPIAMHGVGMSLGGESRPDRSHLARLRDLVDRYRPAIVSEHLAWSGHAGTFYGDLLPLPYDERSLGQVAANIHELQDALGRTVLLENPSRYLEFESSCIPETAFLAELVRRTGCGLLLDINNVYVSAVNLGFHPSAYLAGFPMAAVEEIHLAGHAPDPGTEDRPDAGLLIDAHDRPVADPVWQLYATAIALAGTVPTLIEWDNALPDWQYLAREAAKADSIMAAGRADAHAG